MASDNYVGILNEKFLGRVHYAASNSGPPHSRTFACTCTVDNVQIIGTGTGKSKQTAKKEAAFDFLQKYSVSF